MSHRATDRFETKMNLIKKYRIHTLCLIQYLLSVQYTFCVIVWKYKPTLLYVIFDA